jgi:GNAT superfamily N-acetyltransferase
MKHSFRTVDFDQLAGFWNGFYPERYRITADILRANTVFSPVFDWGGSVVEVADGEILGFVIVKRSAAPLYTVKDADLYHLSAIGYCDRSFGVDLLADLKALLRNRGATRLVFGQDSRHFFPGCPEDFSSLAHFLMVEGFENLGTATDLERDLSDYENKVPIPEGDVMRLLTASDIKSLDAFFLREFPLRWRYDVMAKVEIEGPGCVFGLLHGDRVEGFALLQRETDKVPIGGAVWGTDLGPGWGSLGPIGISASLRGRGSGNALLGSALQNLKERGTRRCIIDWTTLVDFYGKHGFQPSRTYQNLSLGL